MLDLLDGGHKLSRRIFQVDGAAIKIRMGCKIHATFDRCAEHSPSMATIETAYIGSAAKKADSEGCLRRNHDRALPLDVRMISTAAPKSSTSQFGASRASQSRQALPVLTPMGTMPI